MKPNVADRYIALVVALVLLSNTVFAQQKEDSMKDIKASINKSVVFRGTLSEKKQMQFSATGFLVQIQGIFHLVTAKHVVMKREADRFSGVLCDDNLYVFFNTKDKHIALRSIKEIKTNNVHWIFHDNNDVDIALIPFALDVANDDVKVIPDSLFLQNTDSLFELYDVFFLSYQPGITPKQRIHPITRTGTISLINDDKTFYIDGFAFPGNSGSPLFLKPSPIRYDSKGITLGGDPLGFKFVGIIGEYIPYSDVAVSLQTKRPRIIFEENTGLAKVWSTPFINEIIASQDFQTQLQRLLKGEK